MLLARSENIDPFCYYGKNKTSHFTYAPVNDASVSTFLGRSVSLVVSILVSPYFYYGIMSLTVGTPYRPPVTPTDFFSTKVPGVMVTESRVFFSNLNQEPCSRPLIVQN